MKDKVLPLLKARKGISEATTVRDPLLSAIIEGIESDCKETHGIELDPEKPNHVIFLLDWATWKYDNPQDGTTPRSIQFRLHNLIIKEARNSDV